MKSFDEDKALQFLEKCYPHLYDIQMEIEKVKNASGYGDMSASIIIRHKKVFSCDVSHWVKRLYNKSNK